MDNPVAFVFPFTFIPLDVAERISQGFSNVALCLPHGLGLQEGLRPMVEAGKIRLLRPPKGMEPGDAFPYLLREYKTWMFTNYEKGYGGFLKYARDRLREDESVFQIRGVLRGALAGQVEYRDLALKWHLTLHLAHEVQMGLNEAEGLIHSARVMEPLFKEVIPEEETTVNSPQDLPKMDLAEYLDPAQLLDTMEAWAGLFRSYVSPGDSFVTWEEEVVEILIGDKEVEVEDLPGDISCYQLPEFNHLKPETLSILEGKSIHLLRS